MKKIFVLLVSIVMLFTLTACGSKDKEEEVNNNGTTQKESTPTASPKKEENHTQVVIDDEIIDFDDEDNTPPEVEGRVTVSEVINCSGCVYAYFNKEGNEAVKIGDTISSSDYTTDINNLKTMGGKQRHNFFGLVLSGNTISRAYACVLKDSKIYCIEGSTNGAYHNSNIAILNQIFTSGQCETISAGHTYWCTDGNYTGDSQTSGYTSLGYETSCTIYGADANTGKIICH